MIIGAGPIGLVTLLAAKPMGAGDVVVVNCPRHARRKPAELAPTSCSTPRADDVAAVLAERFGEGVDIAFDAGGDSDDDRRALSSVRPKGA